MSSGIKVNTPNLKPEAWENVANVVYQSTFTFSQNFAAVKSWTAKTDERAKAVAEHFDKIEANLQGTDTALEGTQGQLQELSAKFRSMAEKNREQSEGVARCFRHLFGATQALHAHLGKSLAGMDLDVGHGLVAASALASPSVSAPGTSSASAAASSQELQSLCSALEVSSGSLDTVFERWDARSAAEEKRQSDMQSTIEALRSGAERSRERLLSWREMLKESSHAIDSVSSSVVALRADVRELQANSVRQHDVDETVAKASKILEELHDQTEGRVDGLQQHVEDHMHQVEKHLEDLRRETDERLGQHTAQVFEMLEQNLNPVNAYLNTMHLKFDVARLDIDGLSAKVPQIAALIEDVIGQFKKSLKEAADDRGNLRGLIDGLTTKTDDFSVWAKAEDAALHRSLQAVVNELGGKIEGLHGDLSNTKKALEHTKNSELAGVARDLSTLETKVAKWVHAHPLPAKISEARIYSLEMRLSQETESRLLLEDMINNGSRVLHPRHMQQMRREQDSVDMGTAHQLPQLTAR